MRIRNTTREAMLAEAADIADTSSKRRVGLLRHESLPAGTALWIVPCEAVHTFGMKFPIDVVFLNKRHKVLKIRANMVPRRISACLRAHSVLELPAGTADKTQTSPGDILEFER